MGWMRDRRVLVGAAAAYLVTVVVLVAGPWGQELNDVTVACYAWFRYHWPLAPLWALPEHYGVLLNVLFFVPAGALLGELKLVPSWPAHGWLVTLALTSQVLGWLLITSSLPRLPAALSSMLLTIQPVGSVLLAIAIFGEAPSGLQLAGVAAVLCGLVLVARARPAPGPT